MSSKMNFKALLWITAALAVTSLMGLNYYYARHHDWASGREGLLTEALSRLDECERKIKSALPDEALRHVLEGTSENGNGIRAERQLLIAKNSAEMLKRLEEICAPLRIQGRLKTEFEIEEGHDGIILKMVVLNQV